jgi:hypothetical protein
MVENNPSVVQEELGHRGWYPGYRSLGPTRIIGVLMSDPVPLKNVYLPLRPGVCARTVWERRRSWLVLMR